jgi:hypothetical protein
MYSLGLMYLPTVTKEWEISPPPVWISRVSIPSRLDKDFLYLQWGPEMCILKQE